MISVWQRTKIEIKSKQIKNEVEMKVKLPMEKKQNDRVYLFMTRKRRNVLQTF